MSRQQERDELLAAILDHLKSRGPGWVTAKEVSLEIGYPSRQVARALPNIPGIEPAKLHTKRERSRAKVCAMYRYWGGGFDPTAFPRWMLVIPPNTLPGVGTIVRGYASLHDEQTLSESAND